MTRYLRAPPRRIPATPILAFLIVFALSGCCSDRPHRGQSVPIPSAISAAVDGANPLVYGQARFDGGMVHFDVKLVESGTPDAARMDLRWQSHSGHTSPLTWSFDPQDSYTNDPPTQRWYVFSVPATADTTLSCFHLQVSLYKANGTPLGQVQRSFEPMQQTNWGTAFGP